MRIPPIANVEKKETHMPWARVRKSRETDKAGAESSAFAGAIMSEKEKFSQRKNVIKMSGLSFLPGPVCQDFWVWVFPEQRPMALSAWVPGLLVRHFSQSTSKVPGYYLHVMYVYQKRHYCCVTSPSLCIYFLINL